MYIVNIEQLAVFHLYVGVGDVCLQFTNLGQYVCKGTAAGSYDWGGMLSCRHLQYDVPMGNDGINVNVGACLGVFNGKQSPDFSLVISAVQGDVTV